MKNSRVDESSVPSKIAGRREFSGRREFCTPLVVESSVVDESSVVWNSWVDESSVPPKSSVFGRREFCPLVDESSVVDESSFSPPFYLAWIYKKGQTFLEMLIPNSLLIHTIVLKNRFLISGQFFRVTSPHGTSVVLDTQAKNRII